MVRPGLERAGGLQGELGGLDPAVHGTERNLQRVRLSPRRRRPRKRDGAQHADQFPVLPERGGRRICRPEPGPWQVRSLPALQLRRLPERRRGADRRGQPRGPLPQQPRPVRRRVGWAVEHALCRRARASVNAGLGLRHPRHPAEHGPSDQRCDPVGGRAGSPATSSLPGDLTALELERIIDSGTPSSPTFVGGFGSTHPGKGPTSPSATAPCGSSSRRSTRRSTGDWAIGPMESCSMKMRFDASGFERIERPSRSSSSSS